SWSSEIEQRRYPLAEELELLERIADGPQEHALDARLGEAGKPIRARLRRGDQQPFAELLRGPPERGRHPLLEDAAGARRVVLDAEHHRGERVRERLGILAVLRQLATE